MNTAALRLVIQTTQVRARDSGEASRTFADQAARTASADATRGPALERFASAYVDKVPDALEALLLQARAVAFEAPLTGVLERALAGFAPAALAQAPSASLALLAAASIACSKACRSASPPGGAPPARRPRPAWAISSPTRCWASSPSPPWKTPWTAGWMTWTPASRRRSPSSAFSRGNGVAP